MDYVNLASRAMDARKMAYAPYSHFAVGAALLCADGTIYTGCNVESAAYAPTICAERTAFVKAVSDGKRDFTAIAIAGGKRNESVTECYPCGVCRQTMVEFCREDFIILIARSETDVLQTTLGALLPHSFGPNNLQ